jgi:hypothetical protein
MMKNADLWRRIGEYRMDGRFEEKLARENGWSLEFAARVVREYRRFAYLAIAATWPARRTRSTRRGIST